LRRAANSGSKLTISQGNIFVWALNQYRDKTSLVPITHFKAHSQFITRVLLSPDVKHLATCSADHTAKIWEVKDLDKMNPMASSTTSNGDSNGTGATPGSSTNTNGNGNNSNANGGGSSSTEELAKPTPFKLESTLTGHQRWVWDCAFSADSAYLVTACSDHYARLWELHTETIIRQYNGHHRGAVCVALNDYSWR